MILKRIRMKKEDGEILKKSVEKTAQVFMDMGVTSTDTKDQKKGG